jgi:hypothetical protein
VGLHDEPVVPELNANAETRCREVYATRRTPSPGMKSLAVLTASNICSGVRHLAVNYASEGLGQAGPIFIAGGRAVADYTEVL